MGVAEVGDGADRAGPHGSEGESERCAPWAAAAMLMGQGLGGERGRAARLLQVKGEARPG